MSNILKVKDANGNWIDIPAIVGPKGDAGGADYITQRGTSDILPPDPSYGDKAVGTWTWKKWASGDAECWATVRDVKMYVAYGGEAPYELTCSLPLPASLFADRSYSVLIQVNGYGVPNIFKYEDFSSKSILDLCAYTEDEEDITANMTIIVKGRWN